MVFTLCVRVEGLVDSLLKLLDPESEVLLFVAVREGVDEEAFAGLSLFPFTVEGIAIVVVVLFTGRIEGETSSRILMREG